MSHKVRIYCESATPRLLKYYLWKRNWDLVGELLIVLHAINGQKGNLWREAWALLLRAQETDGSYCGPEGDSGDEYRELHRGVDESEGGRAHDEAWGEFLERYHTTLVALLAVRICFGVRLTTYGRSP